MANTTARKLLDPEIPHGPQHAHYLGSACGLAYLNEDEGRVKFQTDLNLNARLISVDNTQAYVGENDRSIVIAFRGSQSFASLDGFKDWLLTNSRNFLVLPEGRIGTDFSAAGVGARFHRGFMDALAEIWEPLYEEIDEAYSRQPRPVWLTGHSLGGALALLCAWRLHQNFVPVHMICTFGAPMVGNRAAAEAFQREFPNQIYRYVDAGDIVPRLPTFSLFSNAYNHCQQEIVVGEPTALSTAARVFENVAATAVETVEGTISSKVANTLWSELRGGMPSHLMGNYLTRIQSKLGTI